jgi:hypothetical protein
VDAFMAAWRAQGGSDVESELAPIMASARTAHTPIAAERAS